jgi:hypothetical protein
MTIYDDTDGGYYTACNDCEWAGSLFDLYRKLRGIQDVRSAWMQLITDLEIKPPSHLMTQKAIDDYQTIQEKNFRIENFWSKSKKKLNREMPAESTSILQDLHLWGTYDVNSFGDKLGKFMGCNDRLAVEDIYPFIGSSELNSGVKNCIILRYEKLPGKTTAFLFIGYAKRLFKFVDKSEAGILGLEASLTQLDKVYVVSDPVLFLQLQKRALKDSSNPLPLLCCVSQIDGTFKRITSSAWKAVQQEKVIFWDFESPVELINQARVLGSRGYIATSPDVPKVEPHVLLDKYVTIPQLQKKWDSSAVHWLEFLKTKLVESTPSDALRILEKLTQPLTQEEWDKITSLCTPEEQRKIKFLVQPDAYSRTFTHDGHTYIERPGLGWYKINKIVRPGEPLEALITEAYPIIRQATLVDGEVHFTGEIVFKDTRLPFSISESEFREEPAKYITKICVQHECGMPQFKYEYRKSLVDLALANHKPEVSKAIEKVGWNDKIETFVFPQFRISNGHLTGILNSSHNKIPGSNISGYDKYPPASLTDRIRNFKQAGVDTGWSILGCILANIISGYVKEEKRGILILDPNETGGIILDQLGSQIGLQSYRVRDENINELHKLESKHDVPLRLFTDKVTPEWSDWLTFTGPRNCILTVGLETAHNLSLLDKWYIIKVPHKQLGDLSYLNQLELIIPVFLKHLTKTKEFRKDIPLPQAVLQEIFALLDQGSAVPDSESCLAQIQNNLKTLVLEHWERFLHVLFFMIDKGYTEIGDSSTRAGAKLPVSKDGSNYFINWDAACRAMTTQHFFIPDVEKLDNSFTSNKDKGISDDPKGWLVSNSLWHLTYANWKALYS